MLGTASQWAIWPVGLLLAHLSQRLKWAFLIICCPLSCHPSVSLILCKLFIFSTSPKPLVQFQQNLAQSILAFCSNEGLLPLPRGDNGEIHWQHLKISSEPVGYFQTNGVKGIQIWINKKPCPFSRVDNNNFESTCMYNHGFAQAWTLLGNISQLIVVGLLISLNQYYGIINQYHGIIIDLHKWINWLEMFLRGVMWAVGLLFLYFFVPGMEDWGACCFYPVCHSVIP